MTAAAPTPTPDGPTEQAAEDLARGLLLGSPVGSTFTVAMTADARAGVALLRRPDRSLGVFSWDSYHALHAAAPTGITWGRAGVLIPLAEGLERSLLEGDPTISRALLAELREVS